MMHSNERQGRVGQGKTWHGRAGQWTGRVTSLEPS